MIFVGFFISISCFMTRKRAKQSGWEFLMCVGFIFRTGEYGGTT